MSPPLRYRSSSASHPGAVRPHNEDALHEDAQSGVWAVADGMGGHENGRWAADTVVSALAHAPLNGSPEADVQALADAAGQANAAIHAHAQARGATMGTTLAGLVCREGRAFAFWAGDSRVYRVRAGSIARLTRDHTAVQDLVDQGALRPEDAETHPMGHVLARAIGPEAQVAVDVVEEAVLPDDAFVLCSDGLIRVVEEREIAAAVASGDPAHAADGLVQAAVSRGAPDNVTVITVACEEATQLLGAGT